MFPVVYEAMGEFKETLGDRLKRFREMKGWSYRQAAAAYGVTATAVHKWEHGQTQLIAYPTLERIASAHGTDVPYIVWGDARGPDKGPSGSSPVDRSGRYRKL